MKPIKIDAFIPEIMEAVQKALQDIKACDTKMSFSWDISAVFKAVVKDRLKPTVDIEAVAWTKMMMLVQACGTELAWHCVVERPEPNRFVIKDVLMYPQETTGTAVDSNDDKYHKWLDTLDDETFAKLRGQGHSHVNMGVTPSTADTAFYQRMLTNLNDYYLFLIVNKRQDVWMNLYDIQNNLIYDEQDITMNVVDLQGNDIEEWAMKQLEFIEKPKPVEKKPEAPRPNYTFQTRTDTQGRPLDVSGKVKPQELWTDAEAEQFLYTQDNLDRARFGGYLDANRHYQAR